MVGPVDREPARESTAASGRKELERYLSLLRRWWWLLLAGPIVAGTVAYLVTRTITPTYEASATLLVNPPQQPGAVVYSDILASERLTRTYRELITQRPVLEDVAASGEFPGLTVGELNSVLDVDVVGDTQLLKVAVRDDDPERAARLSNAVAGAFVAQQQEKPTLTRPGAVSLVEPAEQPRSPVSPNMRLNIALALVVGLLLSGAVVLLLEYLDDTIKSAEDVTARFGLPTLGEVARWQSPNDAIHLAERGDGELEAYGVLRTNIQFSSLDKPAQVVLVTSANVSEGKSTTAANYALALADAGKTVALVDSDMRRPSLHLPFKLGNSVGLSSALLMDASLDGDTLHATSRRGLFLMTSGPLPPNPAELLDWQGFDEVLEGLKDIFDVVVLDSPPVLAVADARILASKSDATILVVDSGRTRTAAVRRALQALANANANVLGVVLNKVRRSARSYYYYYYSDSKGHSPAPIPADAAALHGRNGNDASAPWPAVPSNASQLFHGDGIRETVQPSHSPTSVEASRDIAKEDQR